MNQPVEQAMSQLEQLQANLHFMAVTTFICIIICAVCAMLSLWKLFQIRKTLELFRIQLTSYIAFAQAREDAHRRTKEPRDG